MSEKTFKQWFSERSREGITLLIFVSMFSQWLAACGAAEVNANNNNDNNSGDGNNGEFAGGVELTPGISINNPSTIETPVVPEDVVGFTERALPYEEAVDFYQDDVYWYEPSANSQQKLENEVGTESPFFVIAAIEQDRGDGVEKVRRAVVSRNITTFEMATEIAPDKWVVETQLFPGVAQEIDGLDGYWQLYGYYANGVPVEGSAYQVDENGKFTGHMAMCNYLSGTCYPVEVKNMGGRSGDYFASLPPQFEVGHSEMLRQLGDWGVPRGDYAQWEFSFNDKKDKFGVFLEEGALFVLGGDVEIQLADRSTVTIPKDKIKYNDKGNFDFAGYEWDAETGAWVEAESAAMQQTNALIEQYNIDPETVTVTEAGGAVNVTDKETGTVLIRTIGEQSKFDLGFAVDTIAKNSCEPTEFEPDYNGLIPAGVYGQDFVKYMRGLTAEAGYSLSTSDAWRYFLIDRERQCWGEVVGNDEKGYTTIFRDAELKLHVLPLLPITLKELDEFKISR